MSFCFRIEESLDENALDFELKRIKERRAQEEVLMGKYRHPNFSSRISFNSME